jgi:3-hydroxybutyryl-CoA dehydrogenase
MSTSLAVVGAGLMGSGIAQVAAVAGHDVVLRDVTDAALGKGMASIEKSLGRFVAKGTLEASDAEAALARITTTTDLDAVAPADVVVEAAFESVEVKQGIFRELDRLCRDGAVLATNTSAIPITQIGAVTERPEAVVGTHFFSPVSLSRMVAAGDLGRKSGRGFYTYDS